MIRNVGNAILAALLIGAVLFNISVSVGSLSAMALSGSVLAMVWVSMWGATKPKQKEGEPTPKAVIAVRMALGVVTIAILAHVSKGTPYFEWLLWLSVAWYVISTAVQIKRDTWGFSFTAYIPVFAAGMSLMLGNHWLSPASIFALMLSGNLLSMIGMKMDRHGVAWAAVPILWITGLVIATTP